MEEEEGVEVSRRNLQKYIAAQEAGSNRASSVPRDPRYRRAISRRLVAGDRCSAWRVELRKSELTCPRPPTAVTIPKNTLLVDDEASTRLDEMRNASSRRRDNSRATSQQVLLSVGSF